MTNIIPLPPTTQALAHHSPAIAEVAISSYLEKVKHDLANIVEMTGPESIALKKAEIATAAEATKQLGLSKEIQLDAQEMVRRAEYALGKAIRKGQEDGTIMRAGADGPAARDDLGGTNAKVRVTDLAPAHELRGQTGEFDGIYHMSDGVSQAAFDAAIDEAKAEGRLTRRNVVRKIKKQDCDRPAPVTARLDEIRNLIARGANSAQIGKELGVSEQRIREICRNNAITITADEITRGRRRIDDNRVLNNVTESIEVAAMSLRDIDPANLDEEEALERLDSLTTSINALRQAVKKIKESFHD